MTETHGHEPVIGTPLPSKSCSYQTKRKIALIGCIGVEHLNLLGLFAAPVPEFFLHLAQKVDLLKILNHSTSLGFTKEMWPLCECVFMY